MRPLNPRKYKVVPGRFYGTPKELWGFRTPPRPGDTVAVARAFLRANAKVLGITRIRSRLTHRRTIESLGAAHVIFQQEHRGYRIHRAYVTVHIDRDGRIYLAKNRAVPKNFLPGRRSVKVTAKGAQRRVLSGLKLSPRTSVLFDPELLWFPLEERLRLAYRVRVHRRRPRQEWLAYVDATTGKILSAYDNLSWGAGLAAIFDPNPVAAVSDWRRLLRNGRVVPPPQSAYREVRLRDLDGTGYLEGRRVTTKPTPGRVKNDRHRFLFKSTQRGFDEAMVYYHIDRAIRYLESLGYDGSRAIFGAERLPVPVNAHGTKADNSWYSPGLRQLTFGSGGVDDAEDGEIILHEFGHALQDAICPDFGQSQEAAAMGEGFGDYLAASFFASRKRRALRTLVGMWDAIKDAEGDLPYLRRLDRPLTFEAFDFSDDADEHENGEIWGATLWKIREAVGRRVADRIIIDSHFQLDGFTRFARGARAIIDADRNLYEGRHVRALIQIFRQQGIGPVE